MGRGILWHLEFIIKPILKTKVPERKLASISRSESKNFSTNYFYKKTILNLIRKTENTKHRLSEISEHAKDFNLCLFSHTTVLNLSRFLCFPAFYH